MKMDGLISIGKEQPVSVKTRISAGRSDLGGGKGRRLTQGETGVLHGCGGTGGEEVI